MKFELKPYNINVPDKDLIEDLKKVALKLHKETITIADYNKTWKV